MESYEQKYKAALEWMQGMYGGLHGKTKEEAEKYFPELKESKDEKVKRIIHSISNKISFHLHDIFTKEEFQCFDAWSNAWLKKQSKPKFKVGNWYQCTKDFFGKGVTFDKNTAYYCAKEGCLQDEYGCHIAIVKDLYDNFKLWTIQDAKDGDVLACENGWTCIFKTLVNDETFSSYCFMDNTEWFCETGSECHTLREEFIKAYNGKIYPATKEQRDLLFAKMKETGYEWDGNKKELMKIEQKSKWTEENEERLQSCIISLQGKGLMGGVADLNF